MPKYILIIGTFLIPYVCNGNTYDSSIKDTNTFEIDIISYNYSLSYNILYHLSKDTFCITSFGTLTDELKDTVLFKGSITHLENLKYRNIINKTVQKKLKNVYQNPLISDGERQYVKIRIGNKAKNYKIVNVYQKDIYLLFSILNKSITDRKLKIELLPNSKL